MVPGREITKCMLMVTPLAFWACDCSILPMETLLQEYCRAALKLSSVDGTTASVYLSNTYNENDDQ